MTFIVPFQVLALNIARLVGVGCVVSFGWVGWSEIRGRPRIGRAHVRYFLVSSQLDRSFEQSLSYSSFMPPSLLVASQDWSFLAYILRTRPRSNHSHQSDVYDIIYHHTRDNKEESFRYRLGNAGSMSSTFQKDPHQKRRGYPAETPDIPTPPAPYLNRRLT